jgi:hypothetical protein
MISNDSVSSPSLLGSRPEGEIRQTGPNYPKAWFRWMSFLSDLSNVSR